MKIDSYTSKGSKQNEDFVFVNNQMGILLDGVSGLYEKQVTDGKSDAQWFSHTMGEKLIQALENREKSIQTCVSECCEECMKMYKIFLKEKSWSFEEEMLPSSTLSIVRINGNEIEFYQLGDSPIFVDTFEELQMWDDQVIEENDQLALEQVIENARKNNTNVCDEVGSVKEILKSNRQKKNTEKGYWILEPLGKGISHGTYQIYNKEQVKWIGVMSDGFWEMMNIFELYSSKQEFFKDIFLADNLKNMVEKLREEQRKDSLLNQYPRFKLMDDATIFYFNFEK